MKTSALLIVTTVAQASAACPTNRLFQCILDRDYDVRFCLRNCIGPNRETPTPTIQCNDLPGNSGVDWNNGNGQGCDEYDRFDFCEDFGDIPPFNGEGTANEKCCACGGGSSGSSPPAAAPTMPPTIAPPAPTPPPTPPMECPYPDLMTCIEDCPILLPDVYATCVDTCIAVCGSTLDISDEEHLDRLVEWKDAQHSSTPSTWSDCTVPIAPPSNREITFEPAVPIKGENLIQLTGDVNIPVTGGSCATTIDWNGVTVLNDAFPVCGNSTVALPINLGDLYITALPCPTAVGAVAIDIIADISVLAPPGNYVISADCSNSNGTPLACAEVYMRL